MTALALCQGCRREADADFLEPVLSVIDFQLYDLCPSCIHHDCETLTAITRIVRMDVPESWSALPIEIRRAIRVYDRDEYVTVQQWAERMNERQLVVHEAQSGPTETQLDPDDEAVFQRVTEVWRRVRIPKRPPRRGKWLISLLLALLPWRPA